MSPEKDFAWSESEQHGLEGQSKVKQQDVLVITGEHSNDNITAVHVGINVDVNVPEGITKYVTEVMEPVDDEEFVEADDGVVDVNKSIRDIVTEAPIGIAQDQYDTGGTTEVRDSDINVIEKSGEHEEHGVTQGDDENSIGTTDTRQQDEASLDSEVLEGRFEGRNEGILDNEREDRSFGVLGENSNDLNNAAEKIEEMDEREDHLGIMKQSVICKSEHNLENLNQVDEDLVRNQDKLNILKTTDESEIMDDVVRCEEPVSSPLPPQEELQNSCQSQVMSVSDHDQSRESQTIAVHERNLYGHIHNIFGKQQGGKFCVCI